MDEQLAITKVRQKLTSVQQQIDVAKKRVLALEAEAKKLMTTLEVLEKLGEDTVSGVSVYGAQRTTNTATEKDYLTLAQLMNDRPSTLATPVPVWSAHLLGAILSPTTRQLIAAEFASGESLTRNQVVERLKAKDSNVNEGTIATTLSKLTADGILEKAEGNAYRLKKADPGAENTGAVDDLL